ncbi:hypothetical protein [Sutcliffiella deserti]|uniref:hypothetical protein n=1 Tax=Sutcliffiella deserti TaxID=2875501 RepID=UPI001CC05F88|nr:hypothetical protein [Sutcliffiella deserti]
MKQGKKRAVVEWSVAIVLLLTVITQSPYVQYYTLSPLAAHEKSERTFHYGPSEVEEEIDLEKVRVYLGHYKGWFSANTVIRHNMLFWAPGSQVGGQEIEEDEDISYSWSGSSITKDTYLTMFYGIVSNPEIKEVILEMHNEEPLTYPLKDHQMFIFHWYEEDFRQDWVSLQGMDADGKVVYEQKLR